MGINKDSVRRLTVIINLFIIIIFAFWIRLQFINILGGTGDYINWAKENYFGKITSIYYFLSDIILTDQKYNALNYPPGYPIFLTFLKLFNLDLQSIRIIQALLDSLSIFAIFILLRRAKISFFFSILTCYIYAIYPLWAGGCTFILAESLSHILFLWILVLLIYTSEKNSIFLSLLTGILLGFSSLCRPDLILLIIPAFFWILWQQKYKKRIISIIFLLTGFMVLIGFWGYHNKKNHGTWIFTSTTGGAALWSGLGEIKNNYGYVLNDLYVSEMLKEKGMRWLSIESDKYFKKEYLKAWKEHPQFVIKVIWERWKKIIFESERFSFIYSFRNLMDFMDKLGFCFLLISIWLNRKNPIILLITILPLFYALFSIGLTHYEPRYVRYVHFSYLFSIMNILDRIYIGLFSNIKLWNKYKKISLYTFSFIVILFFSYYNIIELSKLFYTSYGVREKASFPTKIKNGEIIKFIGINNIEWIPVFKNIDIKKDQKGNICVQTDNKKYDYQIISKISINRKTKIYIHFILKLIQGGIYLLIINDKGVCTDQKTYVKPGYYNDSLVSIKNNEKISIIIANCNPDKGQSKFCLYKMDIFEEK